MYQKVVGSGILIVGDIHFSDVYSGKHKDYLRNCFTVLGKIRDKVNEMKPAALVILGDIVGVTEGNVRNRETLYQLCTFFQDIRKVCKIYCVRGNHDFNGAFPEFQFLASLGIFETSASCDGYFDYFGTESQEVPEVRFHIMDYGSEHNELNIAAEPTVNIVLAHNNFTIQGLTTWYNAKGGIELGTMSNLRGVYMVISGHIHNPSPQLIMTSMVSGDDCLLFYPGCPTRPSQDQRYDNCWYVEFNYDKSSNTTSYQATPFALEPAKDIFYDDEDFIEDKTEEELAEIERKEALKELLDDIMASRITTGDLVGQVRAVAGASDEAKEIAIGYLQAAIDSRVSK